jgi:hypothetical protein
MIKSTMRCQNPIIRNELRIPICIICEGYEEYEYLTRLQEIGDWRKDIYSVDLINAKSNGNLAARYQDRYMSDAYHLVFIFCDTDLTPYVDFKLLQDKINKFHGNSRAAGKVIVFGNPCTMQIMLLHFGNVKLLSCNKSKNAPNIEKWTGIINYQGHERQRKELFQQVNKKNFAKMLERVKDLPGDSIVKNSSNFYWLMQNLNSKSTCWVERLSKALL